MPTYVTPGVYFETADESRRGITAVRTDVAAFVGLAERGPLHTPVRVNSWEQFRAAFGDFFHAGYLAYSTRAFFENGGRTCYVVRVAATPSTFADPAGPQPGDGSASTALSTTGFRTGDYVRVGQELSPTQSHQEMRRLSAVNHATRSLQWETALQAPFVINDPARPLRFETGALPSVGVLLDEAGVPTLRVEASSPGSWGNRLAVLVRRSHQFATRTTAAAQPADRSFSIVESITGFPAGTLVRIFQEGVPETHRVVSATDPARGRLLWGVWDSVNEEWTPDPLDIAYDLTKPISFESVEFALTVYLGGRAAEHFHGLSFEKFYEPRADDEERPRHYVEDVVNGVALADENLRKKFEGSRLIRVTDLKSPSSYPTRLPDPASANLRRGVLRLEGGQDGLAALTVEDFTGEVGAAKALGVRALEETDEVSSVAMADILIQPVEPPTYAPLPVPEPDPCLPCDVPPVIAEPPPPVTLEQPPAFSVEEVFAAQAALVAHCELLKDRVALLDPPAHTREWVVQSDPLVVFKETVVLDIAEVQSWRQRFDSKYAALYYPWVVVNDPLRLGNRGARALPPSGHVAGIFARTDAEVGVHKAPANAELNWAQGPTVDVSAAEQGVLNPLGVNVIRTFPGRGLRLYGARTVSSDPSWRYVNVRRLLMMIEEAVEESVQWSVFEPNNFALRRTLVLAISSFLGTVWERGALAGATAEESFFVKCDEENNPPPLADLGQLVCEVGVAPAIPAEFVVFRIGKTADQLQITE